MPSLFRNRTLATDPARPRTSEERSLTACSLLTLAFLTLLLVGASIAASAQEAAAPTPVSAKYQAMVGKLLKYSGGEAIGQQMAYGAAQEALVSLSSAGVEITEEIQQIVIEEAMQEFGTRFGDIDYLAELYAPLYAAHLNEKELTELVAFYESPIGQKSMQTLPLVGQAAMQTLQQSTVERLPAYEEKVMTKLRAAGVVVDQEPAN